MDQTLAVFIIALLVVALIAVLLIRTQNRDGGAEAVFTLGELFTAEVRLEPKNTESADDAVKEATLNRGKTTVPDASARAPRATRLARVLWVDDNPDHNLYETIALEQLGRVVTKATSTGAALHYLGALDFALIITDLGRAHDPDAGEDLIRRVRAAGHSLPIVVYTMDAASRRDSLLDGGADAVVDFRRNSFVRSTPICPQWCEPSGKGSYAGCGDRSSGRRPAARRLVMTFVLRGVYPAAGTSLTNTMPSRSATCAGSSGE